MTLHFIDISIIAVYLMVVFTIGYTRNKSRSSSDYLVMGRKLTLPAFVMTLVSTWYGGILGVSEYSTSYGISNWVIFGLPYYVFGIAFALLVAKRARKLEVNSLPEIMVRDYGRSAGRLASIWVLLLASPAPYILTLGLLLNFFVGLPLNMSIVLGTLFSLVYIFNGGFSSVVKTDRLQFVLMFLGFLIILMVLSLKYMNPISLWSTLPPSHRSLTGGNSIAYIVVWFFIGSWTLVDPGFHQRVYATANPEVAKRGILWAVGFWFIFDFMTTLTGLYAFSYLPSDTITSQAFLVLGQNILPVGLQGLFYIAILSTVMSTLDSNTLISGITLGKDVLGGLDRFSKISETSLTKYGMIAVLCVGILMAIWLPSVVSLWYTFGTIAIPALLAPTLLSIANRPMTPISVKLNLIIPPLSAILWFLFAKVDQWSYFWGIEPFYPGIFSSLIILSLFNHTKWKPTHVNNSER